MALYLGNKKVKVISSSGVGSNVTSKNVSTWQRLFNPLPKEYQEVEWIRANESIPAYFDLDLKFDTACTVKISQYIAALDAGVTAYPFGAAENSGTLRCCISSPYDNAIYC